MTTAATIAAKLTLDTSDYDKGLNSASSKADGFASSFSSKMKNVGKSISMVGLGLTAGLTVPIVGMGAGMVKAASDLEESMNAVNVVFGESDKALSNWYETSEYATSFAQSEFNELATVSGALLQNLGFDADSAAEEVLRLTERAVDLGSVFNKDTSVALTAIQSGLKGEMNPLEQFGVKLNAAAVEAKALEMGLGDATGALDDNAKATAILALFYEQTDKVANDYINTQESFANQMKQVKTDIGNMAAELGVILMPYIIEFMGYIRELINKFKALSPEQQKVVLAVLAFVAVIGPLIMIIGGVVTAIGTIGTAITAMAGAVGLAVAPFLLIIAAIIAVVALLWLAWKNNWGDIQGKTKAVVDWITTNVKAFLDKLKAWWAENGDDIKAKVKAAWDGIKFIVDGVLTFIKTIYEAWAAAFSGDWYTFGEKIREAWEGAWDLITTILETAWENITIAIGKLIVSVIQKFMDTDWKEVGINIVKGIGKGLVSMMSWIADKAADVAQAAVDAAKGFLGIKSPSKVFFEMGEYSAQGYGIGLVDSMKKIMPSMNKSLMDGIKAPQASTNVADINTFGSGRNLAPITINYSPFISTASSYEAEQVLRPIIEDAVRGMR